MATVGRVLGRRVARERVGAPPALAIWAAAALATLVGAITRVVPAWAADFPLNDGGMFLVMAREVGHGGYRLPEFTAYNNAGIPFAYPPLGFYLAALLGDATGVALLDLVRVLPGIVALLTIPAFARLADALLRPRERVIAAVFAFALLPRAAVWLSMGGGLTRAPGALCSILTLWQAALLFKGGDRRRILPTALCGGLTVLAHAEWAWFTAYSAALFLLFLGRNRRGVADATLVAAGVVAVSAPWWATVIARHGVAPLLAAAGTGGWTATGWFPLLAFDFTAEPFLPILGVLGLIGCFACLTERSLLLPVWLAATLILQPRSAATLATLPLALLVGAALDRVVLPGLARHAPPADPAARRPSGLAGRTPRLFAAYCLLYGLVCAAALPATQPALRALPPAERAAMAWVAANTPPDSAFLVLPDLGPQSGWWEDHTSEWFPVLASRTSVATVQGSEWLPDGAFARAARRANALRACAEEDAACLAGWGATNGLDFTHVYIAAAGPHGRNAALARSLRAASGYRLVYDGAGTAIFAIEHP